MPVDNHRNYRFSVIDQCLRNSNRKYTIDDLLDVCNRNLERKGYTAVSKRTIYNDLNEMELSPYLARFEKIKDGHRTIIKYERGFPGINVYEVTDEEKDRLDGAIRVLERFEGTPQYDWVRFCLQQVVSDEFMSDNRSIISFQNNPDLTGIDHLMTLLKAIAEKQPLKLTYHPYPIQKDGEIIYREAETYKVHPYHLKQFNDRWFLIAQAEGIPYLGNYPLDRIEKIRPLCKKFIETDIDFEDYFYDAVGVSVYNNIEEVVLRVDKIRYNYIKSKPIHCTQTELQEQETPTHVMLRLKVCINNELEAAILSYGNDVEVLQPESLRQKIAERVKKMASFYKL